MVNPDVQNSAAPLWEHTATNYSEQRWVLAQELANTGEVQNNRCCPIKWMFLALLDSHEKTGQDGRLNRLILMDNWRARRDSNSRPPGS